MEGLIADADHENPAFARSAKQRAFAKAMGDDMSISTAGFADPVGYGVANDDGEILWSE